MSDAIKHECGIAMIRLLKPLDYYIKKYGTPLYGVNKLYLLMEKQHNRGQDGAGVANIKFDVIPGTKYISRTRAVGSGAIKEIFGKINSRFEDINKKNPEKLQDAKWLKKNLPYTGELFLGHLRYGTFGGNSIENCHPFLRQNNWMTRNLVVAGNFNLTNTDELFDQLVELGQHPKEKADTVTVMEKIGHFLDDEIVVVTSERPVIQTAFNIPIDEVKELSPGNALIIKKDGTFGEKEIIEPLEKTSCSFERIYFSRGSDADIYQERQKLGSQLTPSVLKSVDYDLKNTVFSYIPNTAEVAFGGLIEGLHHYAKTIKRHKILQMGSSVRDPELSEILSIRPRV